MEEDEKEKDDKEKKPVQWQASEFIHYAKPPFWYWTAGAITLLGSLDAYLLNNIMLSAIILIGGTSMIGFAGKKPKILSCEIDWRGITIDNDTHRFHEFVSFWIVEKKNENLLLLIPQKTLAQQTIVPLGNADLYTVHSILSKHLPEEQNSEPLAHKLMECLGFSLFCDTLLKHKDNTCSRRSTDRT